MNRFAAIVLVVGLSALSVHGGVAEGDQHWRNRAYGADGARATAAPVDSAIAEFRDALKENPQNHEARWKLMRAMRFKGAYVLTSTDAKRRIFEDAKDIGAKGIEILDGQLGKKGISRPDKADPDEIAKVAKAIPGAGELYYWDAVNWGEWALVFGKMAAVRKGAASTIKRHGEIALEIDPALEGGGPGRVLGRLYNQTPRVPFLTGWASDEKAVQYLQKSLATNPKDKLTTVFLAEAMVAADSSSKEEAKKLLRRVIDTENDAQFAVEHAAAQNDARELLSQW